MKKTWRRCLGLLVSAGMILSLAACSGAVKGSESKAVAETENAGTEASAETGEDQNEQNASAPVTGIDYTVLVNKLNPLPDTWEDELETVHFTNTVGDDVEVEKKAYDAYLQLKEALEAEDIHVDLDSARRSVAAQKEIMDRFIEKYGADYANKTVAQPGYSEHHTGLALDLYLIIDGRDVVENEDMIQ